MKTHYLKTVAVVVCIAAGSVLCLTGCNKADPETLARIDELQTQIKHFEDQLTQAQAGRETLLQNLETLSETLTAARTHVQELMEARQAAVDVKLAEMADQRDAVMSKADESRADLERLQDQLSQQAEQIAGFKLQIADLQAAAAPPKEEVVASAEVEPTETKEPVVGFPEGDDSSVVVIRGRSQD